ncbi:MAG: nucleotidyltransferase family protein [Lachnospiraceae bacterium]|nr:nucleotidyltransferase family protein [Lachnospiraceae bacterium]
MNVTGIIAEYNPFHRGHAYHIAKARELTDADYVIVVMSGNFVQRGAPALTDKFTRAEMALKNGADMVFELPALWAAAAAPDFAAGGTAFLDKLGCVTHISYGCETEKPELLFQLADFLAQEPRDFSLALQKSQRAGMNYPLAMEQAFDGWAKKNPSDDFFSTGAEKFHGILSSPNNILGLEYQKNLLGRHSSLIPCPVPRMGSGYHTPDLETCFSSATAIRNAIFSGREVPLEQYMPKTAANLLPPKKYLLRENDFSQMLYYKLLSESSLGYESYLGSSPFLSNRIKNHLDSFIDYSGFCETVKTKDVTYTKVSRLLLHILLNMTWEDCALSKDLDYIPCFRLLGFRSAAKSLLKIIEKQGDVPILTKPARAKSLLTKKAFSLYEKEIFSSNLYYGLQLQKGKKDSSNEYRKSLVIL